MAVSSQQTPTIDGAHRPHTETGVPTHTETGAPDCAHPPELDCDPRLRLRAGQGAPTPTPAAPLEKKRRENFRVQP